MGFASINSSFSYNALARLLTSGSSDPTATDGVPQTGQINGSKSSAPASPNRTDSVEISDHAKALLSQAQSDQFIANQLHEQVQKNWSSGSVRINSFAGQAAHSASGSNGIPATYIYDTSSAITPGANQPASSVSTEFSLSITATTTSAKDSSGSQSSIVSSEATLSVTAEISSIQPATSSSLLAKTSSSAQGKLYFTPAGSYWMADPGTTVDTTVELLGLMSASDQPGSSTEKQSGSQPTAQFKPSY
jgi:hypothetical protein